MINVKEFVSNLPQLKEDKIKSTMDLILKESETTIEFYREAIKSKYGEALINRTFTFDDWEAVYVRAVFNEKKAFLNKMLETANSFEKCEYFFQNNVPMDKKFRSKVISKMADFAESFEEVADTLTLDENNIFYHENEVLNEKGKSLLKKALNKAYYIKDFDKLADLCSSKNEDLLQEIFEKRAILYPDEFKLD